MQALLFPRSTVDDTSIMAHNLANGDPMLFTIAGSTTAPDTCLLQRVLRGVSVELDLSDTTTADGRKRQAGLPIRVRRSKRAASDSFVLGNVALQTIGETNVTITAAFSTSMPIYGRLQSIILEYFTDQSESVRIGTLQLDMVFDGVSSVCQVTLNVEQFPDLGSWITSLTTTPRNEMAAISTVLFAVFCFLFYFFVFICFIYLFLFFFYFSPPFRSLS